MPSRPASRWQVTGLCLVLAAITFAVFARTTGFGFVQYDDNVYVYENSQVAGGLSLKGLAWIFTHADCNFYHPLTMLSLMADDQLHGLHAGGYHFTNILLHTASAILLFLILRQMTGFLWRSAFVAAVFAIHPLRVESVAWVAERKDVLSALFFMLTLGAYVRYVHKPNSLARYLTVAIVFVLSLLSKPTAVTLPFVLLLLDYWPLQRADSARRLVMEKIPLLALAGVACAVTVMAEGKAVATLANVSMPSRVGNALVSYVVYLRQMVWPANLGVFYPRLENGYPFWTIALSFLLLGSITGCVLAFRRKRPWLLAGWFWYLGMLTPMIGIVQVGDFAHADRMTYLPQIGICVAVTWLAAEWGAKWQASRAAFGSLMTAILAVLMVCSWKQTAYWRDSTTLFEHDLKVTSNNYLATDNLGALMGMHGKLDEAVKLLQEAIRLNPKAASPYFNLGKVYGLLHRPDEALANDKEAVRLIPDNPHYLNTLAWIYATCPKAEIRNGAKAVRMAEKACQITKRQDTDLLDTLAAAYAETGRFDDAIKTTVEIRALADAAHDTNMVDMARQRLELYKAGKPYRDEQ